MKVDKYFFPVLIVGLILYSQSSEDVKVADEMVELAKENVKASERQVQRLQELEDSLKQPTSGYHIRVPRQRPVW